MSEDRFLNFPVPLLRNAFKDIRKTMDNVIDYAGYVFAEKLELGDSTDRMRAAGKYFGITWGDPVRCYKNGEALSDSMPENSPMTGINKDVCFDYYKTHKSEDQIAYLLAFLAIKSIVGSKPYYKTNISQIGARMAGFSSSRDVVNIPDEISRFLTRRKFDRIKFELQMNWSVNFYSHYTRGFYVSFEGKFSLDKLVFEAEKNRKSNKQKELQARQKEARERAIGIINNKK